MTDDSRKIELEVEVPGTPEEVWRAIATGPGISSWYVPHVVEEREGGVATASFGPGPEMQISGRVVAWDPPHRIVFDGGEGVDGLAFEWLVEARDGGTCIVRLVNSGFGSDESWDAHYDAMTEGWKLFLTNLRLHAKYFAGQSAHSLLPMAVWDGPQPAAWSRLTDMLGIPVSVSIGDLVRTNANGSLSMAGTALDTEANRVVLLLTEPAPGTAFVTAEAHGEQVRVSTWMYLYGPDAETISTRDTPLWQQWLDAGGAPPHD
jgi:uncharacterized protein YndB with AHSA1/START domain